MGAGAGSRELRAAGSCRAMSLVEGGTRPAPGLGWAGPLLGGGGGATSEDSGRGGGVGGRDTADSCRCAAPGPRAGSGGRLTGVRWPAGRELTSRCITCPARGTCHSIPVSF